MHPYRPSFLYIFYPSISTNVFPLFSRVDPVWAVREASKDWPATSYWLHNLIDLEYWKRCWIIQEIRQARDIHVYFGSYQKHNWMPWSTLASRHRLRPS